MSLLAQFNVSVRDGVAAKEIDPKRDAAMIEQGRILARAIDGTSTEAGKLSYAQYFIQIAKELHLSPESRAVKSARVGRQTTPTVAQQEQSELDRLRKTRGQRSA